jgi:NAD(P)-dependent dehydrogenase (short-subunit alcohol dehydrogenase family)
LDQFRDRVAVVTGSASGIGLALAERCVGEGMKVVLADVEAAELERQAARLAGAGAEVLALPTDVARAEDVVRLAEASLARFGAVHLVCNNAGVAVDGPIWEASLDDWRWVLGVNLWGVIHGVRTFVPILLEQPGETHVLNTASIAGLVSEPGLGVYKTSKHAVVALSETLDHDLRQRGARVGVSVLCPGFVRTRIAESERNRPARAGAGRPLGDRVRAAVAAGSDAAQVADLAFAAIRARRLHVLTHPAWNPAIAARAQALLREAGPADADRVADFRPPPR